jgi:hypothetical protein
MGVVNSFFLSMSRQAFADKFAIAIDGSGDYNVITGGVS